MVRVRNMSVSKTADIQVRCPNWVRNRLRRYDEDLKGYIFLKNKKLFYLPLRFMYDLVRRFYV